MCNRMGRSALFPLGFGCLNLWGWHFSQAQYRTANHRNRRNYARIEFTDDLEEHVECAECGTRGNYRFLVKDSLQRWGAICDRCALKVCDKHHLTLDFDSMVRMLHHKFPDKVFGMDLSICERFGGDYGIVMVLQGKGLLREVPGEWAWTWVDAHSMDSSDSFSMAATEEDAYVKELQEK